MPKKARITVVRESPTGRNESFRDNVTGRYMNREQFAAAIRHGSYEGYYLREINGIQTPVSKPDGKKYNNLG